MECHKVLISVLWVVTGSLLVCPAEAGLFSWLGSWGEGKNTASVPGNGNVQNGLIQNGPVQNGLVQGSDRPTVVVFGGRGGTQMNFGSIYEVTFRQVNSNDGKCVEKVTIKLKEIKLEKKINKDCPDSGWVKSIQNKGDFLLIGKPDENFCAFTTNKNEIYYLLNGKWKKGGFAGDNTKDKELSSSEVEKVKERIKKWQEVFEKSKKEIERIRGLKREKRESLKQERLRILNLKEQERKTRVQNILKIEQLKNQERTRHYQEKNKFYQMKYKASSGDIDHLMKAEEERYEKKMKELKKMRKEEDERSKKVLDNYDDQFKAEKKKCAKEISKLEASEDAEYKRLMQEVEEKIKQGW